jgi:DUF1680 family protein
MPSIPGYIYAQKNSDLYVNLFVESSTNVTLFGTPVAVKQKTKYPWDGDVRITVSPEVKSKFAVRVRIPGWAQNRPLPGNLYAYDNSLEKAPQLFVNNEIADYSIENGYAVLSREWNEGDEIRLSLPMEVRTVKANNLVEADRGKLAIERGPIVYCVEEIDNSNIDNVMVSGKTQFTTDFQADLLTGIQVVKASGESKNESFTAVPYYVWNNRGANKMAVWLKEY